MSALIARWYAAGLWDANKVQAAVTRGWITQDQADEITG